MIKNKDHWTTDQQRELMKLAGTMSLADLAVKLNITEARIRYRCSRQGLSYAFINKGV